MFFLQESVTFSFHYGQCDKILENVHVCLRSCSKITLRYIVYNSRAFKKSSTERVLNIPEKSSFAVELPPLENTKKWEECFDDMICEKYFNSSRQLNYQQEGYLKCSIGGTNNQLPNTVYKFVYLELFDVKCYVFRKSYLLQAEESGCLWTRVLSFQL